MRLLPVPTDYPSILSQRSNPYFSFPTHTEEGLFLPQRAFHPEIGFTSDPPVLFNELDPEWAGFLYSGR